MTEVMRQRGDTDFIELLNRIRTGEPTDEDEDVLKSRLIKKDDPYYPKNELHMFAENAPGKLHNEEMLLENTNPLYSIVAIDDLPRDKIPFNVIDRALNRSQSETGGLARQLDIRINARVMLTSNIDISDRLTNGQIGTVVQILVDNIGKVLKIYVKFDDHRAGETLKKKDAYGSRENCIPIEKVEVNIRVYQHSEFPVIKRTQFPLILSWACTIHKVQGLTLQKAVVNFDLLRQKSFNPGQIYVALSRVASLNGLCLTGEYKRNAIKSDPKAIDEYSILREQCNMRSPNYHHLQPDNLIITLLNTRSLLKHACDIATDPVLLQSDLLCLTETQMSNSSDKSAVTTNLRDFNEYYNHSEDKFCSLASPYRDSIKIIENLDIASFTVLKFTKSSFSANPVKILLLYRKCSADLSSFTQTFKYLVDSQDVDIILGDFNINASAMNREFAFLSETFMMIVHEPTHISGSLLDHV